MFNPMRLSILFALFLACSALFICLPGRAQTALQPGYNKAEYVELCKAYSRWGDSLFFQGIPESSRYERVYRSSEVGLDNCWELYLDKQGGAPVISIRGSTADPVSWLANFYAAMVPATGVLRLNSASSWSYTLSSRPDASVHSGWLVATAALSADILAKIDSAYQQNTREWIIYGHSQGGAIACLLRAYLHGLQSQNLLPSDIRFKTYCSAAPKPGNLPFAYTYEQITAGGWSITVVNPLDWVPEVPLSVQTVDDFNPVNPFKGAKENFKGLPAKERLALSYVYGQLTRPAVKSQKRYEKFLGSAVASRVEKQLPGLQLPAFAHTGNYVRVGPHKVFSLTGTYQNKFNDNDSSIFVHHMVQPYLFLAEQED